MKLVHFFITLAGLALMAAAPADNRSTPTPIIASDSDGGLSLAMGPGKGKGPNKASNANDHDGGGAEVIIDIVFGDDERRIIRDYFRRTPYEFESLPPGIAMNLARGKPLPPGIAKRFLPGDLSSHLPIREGLERIIFGRKVLLVESSSGLIYDIIEDVLG